MGEFDARPLQRQAGFLEAQEVLPFRGLFIGGNVASRSPELLGRASHILAVNGMSPLDAVAKMFRLTVKVVHLDDHTDEQLWPHLLECAEFIERGRLAAYGHDHLACYDHQQGAASPGAQPAAAVPAAGGGAARPGGVLVHCTLGISRSASIVTSYLMLAGRLRLGDALALLRTARRWVKPNDGFEAQLRHLDHLLFELPPAVAPAPAAGGKGGAGGASDAAAQHPASCCGDAGCPADWPRSLADIPQGTANYAPAPAACELCALRRTTPWHVAEHPAFVILDCDSCDTPMALLRRHGLPLHALPPALAAQMLAALAAVADARYGSSGWYFDGLQRSVCLHTHVHARQGSPPGGKHAGTDGGRGGATIWSEYGFAHPALDPLQPVMAAALSGLHAPALGAPPRPRL